MKPLFFIAIGVLIAGFIFYTRESKWSLFIYPEGDLAAESIKTLNAYDSFEECRAGFSEVTFPRGSFECGYKCKIQDASLGLYICKETRD